MLRLETRNRAHCRHTRQILGDLRTQFGNRSVGLAPTVIASQAIADLYQVDPAHRWTFAIEHLGDCRGGGFVAIQPGQHRPRVETDHALRPLAAAILHQPRRHPAAREPSSQRRGAICSPHHDAVVHGFKRNSGARPKPRSFTKVLGDHDLALGTHPLSHTCQV